MKIVLDTFISTTLYWLLFFAISAGILASSFANLQTIFLTLFLLYSLWCLLFAPKFLLFTYFLFISSNDIFLKEDFLFSLIGIKQILGSLIIIRYYYERRTIKKILGGHQTRPLYKLLKLFNRTMLTVTLYWIYTYFKSYYFGMHDFDLLAAATKSINIILIVYSVSPFLMLLASFAPKETLIKYFFVHVSFMLLFTLMSPYLQAFGLKSAGTIETEFETAAFQRYTGIILNGDSNTLGNYFVLVISSILLLYKAGKKHGIQLLLLSLSLICVALSGSRTAIISLLVVLVVYLFLSKTSTKLKLAILIFSPILVGLSLPYFEMVLSRLALANQQLDINTDTNRIGKWILYFQFFIDNPITFITGAQKELRIAWNDTYYTAHNVFITMIYNAGFSFATLLMFYVIRVINHFKKRKQLADNSLLLLPFLFLILAVSDLGILGSYTTFTIMICILYQKERGLIATPRNVRHRKQLARITESI